MAMFYSSCCITFNRLLWFSIQTGLWPLLELLCVPEPTKYSVTPTSWELFAPRHGATSLKSSSFPYFLLTKHSRIHIFNGSMLCSLSGMSRVLNISPFWYSKGYGTIPFRFKAYSTTDDVQSSLINGLWSRCERQYHNVCLLPAKA